MSKLSDYPGKLRALSDIFEHSNQTLYLFPKQAAQKRAASLVLPKIARICTISIRKILYDIFQVIEFLDIKVQP